MCMTSLVKGKGTNQELSTNRRVLDEDSICLHVCEITCQNAQVGIQEFVNRLLSEVTHIQMTFWQRYHLPACAQNTL